MPRRHLLLSLVVVAGGCSTPSRPATTLAPCDGNRMTTVVNLSRDPVEVVAVRGGVESILVLASPGVASRPFRLPLPGDRELAGGQRRGSSWYLRNASTGRRLAPRDPQVRMESVCVDEHT